jgi:hypothetical protein
MYMWWTGIYSRRETRCNPTPQHSQGRSAVAWPPCRLCYRPTVFFCYIAVSVLSYQPRKFQHNFHKLYFSLFLFLLSLKLRAWNCVPGSRGTSAHESTVTTSQKTQCVFILNTNRLVLVSVIIDVYYEKWGTRLRSRLRHCSGSIPEGVTGIFHWRNHSGRIVAWGWLSLHRNEYQEYFLEGKGGRCYD